MIKLTAGEAAEQQRINDARRFARRLESLSEADICECLDSAPDRAVVSQMQRMLYRLAAEYGRTRRYDQAVGWARDAVFDAYDSERVHLAAHVGGEPNLGPGAELWEQFCKVASLHAASIVMDDLIDASQRDVARIREIGSLTQ